MDGLRERRSREPAPVATKRRIRNRFPPPPLFLHEPGQFRGLERIPVDSTDADKRLQSNVLDHKLRVVGQLPTHARMGSTLSSTVLTGSGSVSSTAKTSTFVRARS